MAKKAEDFQEDLKNSIFNADPKLNRIELLEMIFKAYIGKLFEIVLSRSVSNRLEFSALNQVKRNLISAFRGAELGEYQKSLEWYEHKFDEALQEILNQAGESHDGVDSVEQQPNVLEINQDAYINEGGLYVPEHLKR